MAKNSFNEIAIQENVLYRNNPIDCRFMTSRDILYQRDFLKFPNAVFRVLMVYNKLRPVKPYLPISFAKLRL